jgi:hypothetical protein
MSSNVVRRMPPTLALQQMDADVLAPVLVAADWLVARMERNGCAAERAVPPLRAGDPPCRVHTFQPAVAIATGGSIVAAHQSKTHNKACEATPRAGQFFSVIHDLFSALGLPPH